MYVNFDGDIDVPLMPSPVRIEYRKSNMENHRHSAFINVDHLISSMTDFGEEYLKTV